MAIEGATWRIRDGSDETIATWDPPEVRLKPDTTTVLTTTATPVFICAHGAGGHMEDRSILAVTSALRERGIGTVRFNFFYRARKSGRPDPMPRLTACWTAVIARVREALNPARLIIGGRSMGGRAASVVVAEGASCDGLLLLAYPLHPPGQPQKLRVAHLPAIHVPVLCINGTRDPFCEPQLMEKTLEGLGANWRMHWLEGADHSFHILRSTGRTDRDVLSEVAGEVTTWLPA